ADALIEDYVPECAEDWQGVTIEHALDMTTGHFGSSKLHADENSSTTGRFFNGDDHATKIDYACNEYPRQSDPGEHLVYHTWDTYLAGTAINSRLKSIAGPEADFYDDMLVERIWKPLGLSLLSQATRRTYDEVAQPFTGFGLTFVRDDIARLAQFIGEQDGRLNGEEILDRDLFDAIKQRVPDDPGHVAELEAMRYNNGFRNFDVSGYLGCDEPAWVVVLSGFGGIIVAIMPNDTVYYYFSDGNVHRYLHAVRESHKIRPMCL
ncbi:MAG: serine hydrolase, partial [Woeseiaceae bacterium]|nr:serine hydrolase [Woeseiaceae bacterium]